MVSSETNDNVLGLFEKYQMGGWTTFGDSQWVAYRRLGNVKRWSLDFVDDQREKSLPFFSMAKPESESADQQPIKNNLLSR